ncbi:hypothetical protein PGT21_032102 [Puccinia graminis f. sp. tritici]|uniref:Uncharacterized protein n=1 Tax=Puccinia graminis f. sp. tritici TaxID=56615 RepID=A0A5B0Q8A5_PUCGR|nr:hypothetical protein PGT21_032102 [Puccinia graminis f. sp. tritici]KAA1109309.1 hypothetical protein PGTUg99_027890 [Puccinia graminis f. sp. tritici]
MNSEFYAAHVIVEISSNLFRQQPVNRPEQQEDSLATTVRFAISEQLVLPAIVRKDCSTNPTL